MGEMRVLHPDLSVAYQHLVTAVTARGGAEDWYVLGCLLHDQRKWGAAAGCFARAVERGGDYRALCNLGWNLHLSGRSAEGADKLLAALKLAPREPTPNALLSQVFATLGHDLGAVRYGRVAVEHGPDEPINHMALSFALMAAGRWEEGWREYESRFAYKIPEFLTRPFPLWRGERVEHLFLEAEQGLGDTLMGLRWLPGVLDRVDRVTLYLQREVYALAPYVAGYDPERVLCLPLPQPFPVADMWSPLLSVPVALGLGGPQPAERYIELPRVAAHEGPRRIGIVWAGSPTHEQAHHRDCPLIYWLRLAEVPGVELHSLQVGDASKQIGDVAAYGLVIDRAPEMTNMLDTARVIAGLDLVVTVDTAVAHLAGAMGVPTWMLVNQRGRDFRWGYDGEATDWYPSMRMFRRALDEDWGVVMDRVAGALRG